MKIRKILIANRGEIALRIIRACAEMEICSVAIYSDADRYALHVKQADEAHCIGSEAIAGYLNVHRIVNLAVETNCDALHPGYGFLAENPELAEVCAQRNITFIGPAADISRKMGDKVQARKLMTQAKIPVIPGSEGNVSNVAEAKKNANKVGYPVMLKATAGGGGRGIRQCNNDNELEHNYERVVSEASKFFGDTHVFVEKLIERPRHIEVQVLADQLGSIIHLYERDCSIQRRHQKLIEIAPSPQLSQRQRNKVCKLAIKVAKAVKYENAGTVEFLMDNKGKFYFLEMNTRLQVEHPITEQITGIDIVKEQIRIANGQPLSYSQKAVQARGFAIEFRVNAEDPKQDFLPSFGRITKYYAPGGPGVRTDSAIYMGYEIPPDYDSLCAKLTVWALTWDECIARSQRALNEMRMHGVKTTISYYLEILKTPDFRQGKFDTGFVDAHPELTDYPYYFMPHHKAAAIAAAIAANNQW